eukprot:3177038-Lingulodinium_polyedra.AAC.1
MAMHEVDSGGPQGHVQGRAHHLISVAWHQERHQRGMHENAWNFEAAHATRHHDPLQGRQHQHEGALPERAGGHGS